MLPNILAEVGRKKSVPASQLFWLIKRDYAGGKAKLFELKVDLL
jgi:hypothetical protein